MGGLLGQLEALLADVQHELGEPLLADAADDALGVHLAEPEQEHGAALLVVVVPPAGEVVLYDGSLLKIRAAVTRRQPLQGTAPSCGGNGGLWWRGRVSCRHSPLMFPATQRLIRNPFCSRKLQQ